MRGILLALMFTLAACAQSGPTDGYSQTAIAASGHRVAQIKCARCHAIETAGDSANPSAPPFRDISRGVSIMTSRETLAEGIRIGHREMPPVRLTSAEIDALTAYIRSLQAHDQ